MFQDDSVRWIMDGRKTQTRRVVKHPEFFGCLTGDCPHSQQSECNAALNEYAHQFCPFGAPGTILWVKESFATVCASNGPGVRRYGVTYRADGATLWSDHPTRVYMYDRAGVVSQPVDHPQFQSPRWRNPVAMNRSQCRIRLEVTGVRIERLRDISEEDAKAEGVDSCPVLMSSDPDALEVDSFTAGFLNHWDRTHRIPWRVNPWVWAVSFRLLDCKIRTNTPGAEVHRIKVSCPPEKP